MLKTLFLLFNVQKVKQKNLLILMCQPQHYRLVTLANKFPGWHIHKYDG